MLRFTFLLAAAATLLLNGCVATGNLADQRESRSAAPVYPDLLATARNDISNADFTRLRMAYTATENYQPYVGIEAEINNPMFAALQAEQFEAARDMAERLLSQNYVSLDGHYVAWESYAALGDPQRAHGHKLFLDGLLDSISASGDGATPETAFKVISNQEMLAFLGLHGLQSRSQAVVHGDGTVYNRLVVVDADGRRRQMFFDITLQARHEAENHAN